MKATLRSYLQGGRDSLLWKLVGLSDYDIRRPLVPTGTNLLGLVKHTAHTELDAVGHVPHWPAGSNEVTLHEVLVHVIVDTQRHAGHADILRELIDGSVGLLPANGNMPPVDQAAWRSHHDRLQQLAEDARGPRD